MKLCILLIAFLFQITSHAAEYTNIFKSLGPTYNQVSDDATLTNTPRIRSQDSFGACAGFSASCVLQYNFCEAKNLKCSELNPENEYSPLHVLSTANTNKEGQLPGTIQNHRNIQFGGYGSLALKNLIRMKGRAVSEACYSFDQVANKYGDNDQAVNAMLKRYQERFSSLKTEGGVCEDCLVNLQKDVHRDFGSKVTIDELRNAVRRDTFGEFLYDAVGFGGAVCPSIKIDPLPKYFSFPDSGTTATPEEAVVKMKEVLKQGHPMVLDGLCLYRENGKCVSNHSVAVTGYRKICSKTTGACREVVRLHNSWGQGWQDKFKMGPDDKVGGWVDALSLFEGKKIEAGDIAWLVPPPPKG